MRVVWPLIAALCVSGCTAAPQPPDFRGYFADNNAAAAAGPQAQQEFFRRTQHPDFTDNTCELDDLTVRLDPAWSTLRPDPGFATDGVVPRGEIWAIGVEVTTRANGSATGHQIGSQHLVVLDGRTFAFAPCPR
ncbi:hypothetical protein [Saccharopolyspora dendranthemae]|uniref:LppP/LprE lipoprotein n=1 Tax=Saccharopolyspora dendranthemae TaxID=1181886 RepID=A0A561U631_9PSEU|nr:hypothetical protein [Saccharopolyspora dendranthemae]TWF94818.1 hypothetical protein FHU35_13535 [Saccharopolyspora dendranthemae]